MPSEFEQIAALLADVHVTEMNGWSFTNGRIGDKEIVLFKSGIGKVNAAIGTTLLVETFHPDCIISTGCAGGADTTMQVQDVVVSTELSYHDVYCGNLDGKGELVYGQMQGLPPRFKADERLVSAALSIGNAPHDGAPLPTIHAGLIVTGDWFVDSKDKMRHIADLFPEAKAVDMESAAIAHTCYLYHVPFLSFRVISDIPLKDTDASQYFDFWKTIAEKSFRVTQHLIEQL